MRNIQSFFIEGSLPGLNEIIAAAKSFGNRKTKWNAYAAMKKEYGEIISAYILKSRLVPMEKVGIECTWVCKNRRKDPDNISAGIKFILDALVHQKIIPEDGWQYVRWITHSFELSEGHKKAGIRVTLHNLSDPGLFVR